MDSLIRLANGNDGAAILEVYTPYCLGSPATFELEPPSLAEMQQRIERSDSLYPWIVAETGQSVAGYAYASRHRDRPAYQWSVDVSVYVREGFHGRGFGRALYSELLDRLTRQGFYNAYAGVVLPNPSSLALHQRMGFAPVGIYPQVGYKLGQWHDVQWWHRNLSEPDLAPRTPRPLADLLGQELPDDGR